MKHILLSLIGCSLIFASICSFAAGKTDMETNWVCSTNASSSDVASDVAADKLMSTHATSASKAYALATENCRDCNKITCEVQH